MVNKAIHRIMFDADGMHAHGLHTHDPEVAKRWLHDAPAQAVERGVMRAPYIVHFEPLHHGWPDHQAMRILRRLGARATLGADGFIVIAHPTDAIRRAVGQLGLSIHQDDVDRLEVRAPAGESHGLSVVKSVHRLRPDVEHLPDGSIQIRNLYHYPEADDLETPRKETDWAPQHPLITKRQWAKIPQAVSRRHHIVRQPTKTP